MSISVTNSFCTSTYEYELLQIQITIKHTMQKTISDTNIEIHGIQPWEAWGNIDLKMKQLKGDTK